jgi:hypothetical protein
VGGRSSIATDRRAIRNAHPQHSSRVSFVKQCVDEAHEQSQANEGYQEPLKQLSRIDSCQLLRLSHIRDWPNQLLEGDKKSGFSTGLSDGSVDASP